MEDIQGQPDHRRINIRKVGIKNISYPITVRDRARRIQPTVARVNMYVNLPHHFKGTHMSRFVEILNRFHGEINLESIHHILVEMKERLQAQAAHLEIEFPYFVADPPAAAAADPASQTVPTAPTRTTAPGAEPGKHEANGRGVPPLAASETGICEYLCRMHGSLAAKDELTLDIRIPIAPPRPPAHCSGLPRSLGHWGTAEISLNFRRFVWLEEIIELTAAVTRHNLHWPSAANPAAPDGECSLAVENMARALGEKLAAHPDIRRFKVRVENLAAGFSTFASVT